MIIYLYAHTGHRIGLENLRRLIPMALHFENEMKECEVVTLVNDVRARSFAKEAGLGRVAVIDGVQDIANIVNDDDLLILSSEEPSPSMLEEMRMVYPQFVRFDDSLAPQRYGTELVISPFVEDEGIIKAFPIASTYFEPVEKTEETIFFVGDSDYQEESKDIPLPNGETLLLGHYFSLDLRRTLQEQQKKLCEEEEYAHKVQTAKHIVTGSAYMAVEALVFGGKVALFETPWCESALKESLCKKFSIAPQKSLENPIFGDVLPLFVEDLRSNDVKTLCNKIYNFYVTN